MLDQAGRVAAVEDGGRLDLAEPLAPANTPASWPSAGAGVVVVADGCGVAGGVGVATDTVAAGVLAGALDGAAAGLLDALLALAAGWAGLAEQPVISAAARAATAARPA